MRFRRIAPWVAAGLVVAGVAFSVLLNDLAGSHGEDTWTGVAWAAAALASSGVGLVLAIRRAGNPIGWLLLANGLVLPVHQVATPYADYAVLEDPDALPVAEWAVLIHERAWPTLFICPTAIAMVFPDGRLPSPRWRPLRSWPRFRSPRSPWCPCWRRTATARSSTTSRARCLSCPRPLSGRSLRSSVWARRPAWWRRRWRCERG
jgi:hypothetical protein